MRSVTAGFLLLCRNLRPFLLESVLRPSRGCRRGGHGYIAGRQRDDGSVFPASFWPGILSQRDVVVACRERMQLDRQQVGMDRFQRQMWYLREGMDPNTLFHRPGVAGLFDGVISDHVVSQAEVLKRKFFRSNPDEVNPMALTVGLSGSFFQLLDSRYVLSLVLDLVSEDDALCLALSCRAFRDTLWERFQTGVLNMYVIGHGLPARDVWILEHSVPDSAVRIRTRDAAILRYPSRIDWALGLSSAPWPLGGAGLAIDSVVHTLEHHRLISLLDRRNRTERDVDDWVAWKMVAVAAGLGALDAVRRLRALGYGWNSVAVHAAAGGGHLDMVRYLVSNCALVRVEGLLGLGLPKYQKVCSPSWGRITTAAAAAGGHLGVLEYLIDVVGCPWDACCAYLASYYGRLDVLIWLEGRWNDFGRYPPGSMSMQRGGWEDPHYCNLPRRRRYTPALHGTSGNQVVCASAALGGHLDVLQWARGVESKANRRRFAWNREFCLSFASMPVGQGDCWFGADRPGFDRELCDHAVYAAFAEHHASSAIMNWIVDQPAVEPGEDLAPHDMRCDDPAMYRCAALPVCIRAALR